MKHLITAMASLIILMTVFFQIFTVEFANVKLSMMDQAVYEFRERLKYEGYISAENKEDLSHKLVEITGSKEKPLISGDEEQKDFRQPISYEIKVPMEGFLSNKLVVSKDEHKPYVFKGQVLCCRKEEVKEETKDDVQDEGKDESDDETKDESKDESKDEPKDESDDEGKDEGDKK